MVVPGSWLVDGKLWPRVLVFPMGLCLWEETSTPPGIQSAVSSLVVILAVIIDGPWVMLDIFRSGSWVEH